MSSPGNLGATASVGTWFWGLKNEGGVNVGGMCGANGFATIQVERTFGDWMWTIFTLGIRAPVTVQFACR
jgi:hypothetical protein